MPIMKRPYFIKKFFAITKPEFKVILEANMTKTSAKVISEQIK